MMLCVQKDPIKENWPEEKVLSTIKNYSGYKFDQELVDIFFSILPTFKNVRERYPDPE